MSISDYEKFTAMSNRLARHKPKYDRPGAIEAALDDAFYWGAAVAFGLIGMATEIAKNDRIRLYPCAGCGKLVDAYDNHHACVMPRRNLPEYAAPHCPVSHNGWCPCEPACEIRCLHRDIKPAGDRSETATNDGER